MVQGGLSRNVLVGGCVFFDVCDVWEGHFGVSIDGGTTCNLRTRVILEGKSGLNRLASSGVGFFMVLIAHHWAKKG